MTYFTKLTEEYKILRLNSIMYNVHYVVKLWVL